MTEKKEPWVRESEHPMVRGVEELSAAAREYHNAATKLRPQMYLGEISRRELADALEMAASASAEMQAAAKILRNKLDQTFRVSAACRRLGAQGDLTTRKGVNIQALDAEAARERAIEEIAKVYGDDFEHFSHVEVQSET